MYNFRTDLALERRDLYKKACGLEDEVEGIEIEEEKVDDRVQISRVKVLNQKGADAIGKPVGDYITIDVQKLKIATDEDIRKISRNTF